MAAHFDLAGLSIESFYYFVCKSDSPTMELMGELGVGERMRWRTTSMGIFRGARLHDWGTLVALLKFNEIGIISRLRYGLFAFLSVRRNRWDAETESARSWITRRRGTEVYERLWQPLFALKFYEYVENISAAWIWTWIRRIGRSRKSMMQEELAYIEGGSQTLADALCSAILKRGGRIRTRCAAQKVIVKMVG
jgi:protoporphyrinogen oxidase